MKSFRTFLIEAEVLQKDKILLFLSKHKDEDPRIGKLLKDFKDGKLSERQIEAISYSIKKGTFKKIEKIKQRSGEDRRKGPEERRSENDGWESRRRGERRKERRKGERYESDGWYD